MKHFIYILLASFIFVGCEDSQVSYGRKLWKAYLNKYAKDPSSIVIYEETYIKDDCVNWRIDYGGRNGFGGMDRDILHCRTCNTMLWIGDDFYTSEQLGL